MSFVVYTAEETALHQLQRLSGQLVGIEFPPYGTFRTSGRLAEANGSYLVDQGYVVTYFYAQDVQTVRETTIFLKPFSGGTRRPGSQFYGYLDYMRRGLKVADHPAEGEFEDWMEQVGKGQMLAQDLAAIFEHLRENPDVVGNMLSGLLGDVYALLGVPCEPKAG